MITDIRQPYIVRGKGGNCYGKGYGRKLFQTRYRSHDKG